MEELKESLIAYYSNFESLHHFTAEEILKIINEKSDEINFGKPLTDQTEEIKQLEIELFEDQKN